ncbi:MAG TPA: nucleotidyl transferase AbiEii/AbiGii toxin family protein [Vitreimonas sp.]|uniref:nucleotidyl transferase AbiEii/AbiGii toxin family protein n=1 Tax=Vitreimonas sp. TaxID=3069702 RepID=UPI002D288EF0|nr:nucleotidyl transferase AbiEii/AbiGii toxin family protein [Vitreimonas sp.]HYD86198.1 nucleotidyl transferase AbiEii/AbiGii toxin family protein [Vitreimonas sp.]
MPLTRGQIAALEVIAAGRDPESYVAGSTPLNRHQTRYSADIDIFHDREERVREAADEDAARLASAGFSLNWQRRNGVHTLLAERNGEAVKLEWVADSDFRFFPTTPDLQFGYVLHPVDLAANKAQAAANRRELRDLVDLVAIHESILPLGAVMWAAVEKSPGYTPEGLIAEIRRNSMHPAEEWRRLITSEPVDPAATMAKLRAALDEAEAFVRQMPTDKAGLLFIEAGRVVQPDPFQLDRYVTHAGKRRGHWPSSPEIAAAMMERYKQPG